MSTEISKIATHFGEEIEKIGCPLPIEEHGVRSSWTLLKHSKYILNRLIISQISVSLPTWMSVVGYEEGDPVVKNLMKIGYKQFNNLNDTVYIT